MPELRQNFFTKEWAIIATERAKPPEELATHRPAQTVPPFVESWLFCPGNESKTPSEIMRYPARRASPGRCESSPTSSLHSPATCTHKKSAGCLATH